MSQQQEAPSANTPRRSAPMTLVGEKRLPDGPEPPPPASQTPTTERVWPTAAPTIPTTTTPHSGGAWQAGAMGAINVLATLLAVRLTLLVSVGGAISLTWLAVQQPDPYRLAALGVYAGVVVVPLVWLAARR